jgi:hypothetical protein
MKEEGIFDMVKQSNDSIVRELRSILADFKSTIEKETAPCKKLRLTGSSSQESCIK